MKEEITHLLTKLRFSEERTVRTHFTHYLLQRQHTLLDLVHAFTVKNYHYFNLYNRKKSYLTHDCILFSVNSYVYIFQFKTCIRAYVLYHSTSHATPHLLLLLHLIRILFTFKKNYNAIII